MKKDKLYLTIIIILVIILIVLTLFSINKLNSKEKEITCIKELTLLDVKYENKYIINIGKEKEIASFVMINDFGNLDNTKKEEIKKQLGINENSNYKCNEKNGLVCTIKSNETLDSNNSEKKYWYYTYIENLKDDGYVCSE